MLLKIRKKNLEKVLYYRTRYRKKPPIFSSVCLFSILIFHFYVKLKKAFKLMNLINIIESAEPASIVIRNINTHYRF